jgi:hypothetical protein
MLIKPLIATSGTTRRSLKLSRRSSRSPAPSSRLVKPALGRIHTRQCSLYDSLLDMNHTYKQTNKHYIAWCSLKPAHNFATASIGRPLFLIGCYVPNATWTSSDWTGQHHAREPLASLPTCRIVSYWQPDCMLVKPLKT